MVKIFAYWSPARILWLTFLYIKWYKLSETPEEHITQHFGNWIPLVAHDRSTSEVHHVFLNQERKHLRNAGTVYQSYLISFDTQRDQSVIRNWSSSALSIRFFSLFCSRERCWSLLLLYFTHFSIIVRYPNPMLIIISLITRIRCRMFCSPLWKHLY